MLLGNELTLYIWFWTIPLSIRQSPIGLFHNIRADRFRALGRWDQSFGPPPGR